MEKKYVERLCKCCNIVMQLPIVMSKNSRQGEIKKPWDTKVFCSRECKHEWESKVPWDERINKEKADKIRKTRSERNKGSNNPSCNPEVAKKIGKSLSKYLNENPNARIGEKNPFYGKTHTDEIKKFLSEKFKGKPLSQEHYERLIATRKYGEEHPNWNGGSSFLPYAPTFTKQLKKEIKERDNYTCQLCYKETQKLHIHHIDYDKLNSDKINLISLCNNCHSKTNYNRDEWKTLFQSLIIKINNKNE